MIKASEKAVLSIIQKNAPIECGNNTGNRNQKPFFKQSILNVLYLKGNKFKIFEKTQHLMNTLSGTPHCNYLWSSRASPANKGLIVKLQSLYTGCS